MSKCLSTIHFIPNSNITVDYWNPNTSKRQFIRFMTLIRMEDSQLEFIRKSNYQVHTSLPNKWILCEYFKIPESRVVSLKWNETTEIYDQEAKEHIKVTVLEANYCIGSCMFLFQGSFGNILFTGYFRPPLQKHIFEVPALKSLIEQKAVDIVYIDNSYAAEHCEFPSRADIIKKVVSLIREHPTHKIIISGKPIGKEEILIDIAKTFDKKIWVSKDKYNFLKQLDIAEHFTTNRLATNIVAENQPFSLNECRFRQAREGPCLIILLTALYEFDENSPAHRDTLNIPNLHILPYSGHCCHSELMSFLSILKARQIKPLIAEETSRNCVIPDSMSKMCYNPADSFPLIDSDWGFQTCPDITNPDEPTCTVENPPLAENSPHYSDAHGVRDPDRTDENYTSMELCQSVVQGKNCSKSLMETDTPSTADDVFYDAGSSVDNVDRGDESLNNCGELQQNNSPTTKCTLNLKPNQELDDSSDDTFEDTVEENFPKNELDFNHDLSQSEHISTAETSTVNCSRSAKDNSLEHDQDKNSSNYTSNQKATQCSDVDSSNISEECQKDSSNLEQSQIVIPSLMTHDATYVDDSSSIISNKSKGEDGLLTNNSDSHDDICMMKNLSSDSQDSSEIIKASDPVHTTENLIENSTIMKQNFSDDANAIKRQRLSEDESRSNKSIWKTTLLSNDNQLATNPSLTEPSEQNMEQLRQSRTDDTSIIRNSNENPNDASFDKLNANNSELPNESSNALHETASEFHPAKCSSDSAGAVILRVSRGMTEEQVVNVNRYLWHCTMLMRPEDRNVEVERWCEEMNEFRFNPWL